MLVAMENTALFRPLLIFSWDFLGTHLGAQ